MSRIGNKNGRGNKGRKFTLEHRNKLRLAKLGKKQSPEQVEKRRLKMFGNKSRTGQIQSIEERYKKSEALKGEKCYLWKGGITEINQKIRSSIEYRLWREAVYARDNWTCQECKERGGDLQADHIKPFALYPELRLAIDNGRTLCKACHLKTATWGSKSIIRSNVPINNPPQ